MISLVLLGMVPTSGTSVPRAWHDHRAVTPVDDPDLEEVTGRQRSDHHQETFRARHPLKRADVTYDDM